MDINKIYSARFERDMRKYAEMQEQLEKSLQKEIDEYNQRMFYVRHTIGEYHKLSPSKKLEYIPGWVNYTLNYELKLHPYKVHYEYASLLEYTCEQLFKRQDSDYYLESYGTMLPLTPNVDLYLRNYNP